MKVLANIASSVRCGELKRISVRDALPQAPCMSAAVHRGAAVGLPWSTLVALSVLSKRRS